MTTDATAAAAAASATGNDTISRPVGVAEVQKYADWVFANTASVYEAVGLTNLSHMTIRRRIFQGRIRAVAFLGNWRVWREDLAGLK